MNFIATTSSSLAARDGGRVSLTSSSVNSMTTTVRRSFDVFGEPDDGATREDQVLGAQELDEPS